jgi:riboflavin synthase
MFTGIAAGTGKITAKRMVGGGVGFDFMTTFDLTDPEEGESIAVNGVCLTAYSIIGRTFSADVSPETLSRTILGDMGPGATVNLERALRLSDRLGGHLVSGHVDCLASVTGVNKLGDYTLFTFSFPKVYDRYIIEKGSITINGVSLTVNSVENGKFEVSIIPHTLLVTTLGALKIGSKVNIEVDIIGKYVEKMLAPGVEPSSNDEKKEGINPSFLLKHGFM